MVWNHMFRGAEEGLIYSFCEKLYHVPLICATDFYVKWCPPPAVPSANYFGPQRGEGLCPFNHIPLEVFTTKVNIIHTNAPTSAKGTAGGGHHFTEKSVAQTRGTGFGCLQKTVNHTLCSPSKHMTPNHHLPWWGTRTPTGAVSAL